MLGTEWQKREREMLQEKNKTNQQTLHQRRQWLVYNTRKSTGVHEKRLRIFTLATKNISHQDKSSSISYKPPLTFNFLFLLLLLIQNKSWLMAFLETEIKRQIWERMRETRSCWMIQQLYSPTLFSSKCLMCPSF